MAVPPAPLGTVALFIVVVGSPVSTVHVNDAGDTSSLFPAASTALTSNVCSPSERPVMSLGEEQLAEENAAPSSEHSNGVVGCSAILSVPENVNLIELKAVKMGGVLPRMLVPLPPLGSVAELIAVSGFIVSLNMAASHVQTSYGCDCSGRGIFVHKFISFSRIEVVNYVVCIATVKCICTGTPSKLIFSISAV